jgi:hypothetical protein
MLHRLRGSIVGTFDFFFLGENLERDCSQIGIGFVCTIGLHDEGIRDKFHFRSLRRC